MIIFDLDGTLIDSEYFLKKVEAELKCELGFPITVEEQIELYPGIGPYQQLEMDSRLPQEFAPLAEKRFLERADTELAPNPGVIDFLNNYQGQKCIASNGPLMWIETALKATGLNIFFENSRLYHVGLVKNKKPAPDMFLLATRDIKNKSDIIVVEDSLTGATAAKAADLKTFAYLGSSRDPDKLEKEMLNLGVDKVFNNFDELLNHFGLKIQRL